ncbi:MAG: hypothetical protein KC431_23380 [Myxococcales bacterium]|nr:hypothetical protein [Myxococcales bacterium]MCA9700489.1 hypothetical protein [Myxococcales bacterium]
MKRICCTSLAVSLLVLPACSGGASADAVKLVPDEAEFIVGMNPKAITGSEVYKAFSEDMEKEDDYKEMMKVFEDCNLKPTEFDSVVVGATAKEDFVAVVVGAGVGKDENASCVIKGIQKMGGEEEAAEVSTNEGKKIIQFEDGRAYLVNDNMLALTTTSWETKIGELIDKKGTPAVENSKKDLFSKVDSKAAMWFVANVPAEVAGMGAMLGAPEIADVKTAIGSVDLSKGVALNFVAGFGDEAKAKAVAEKINGMVTEMKNIPDAKEFENVTNSLKIEAAGGDVNFAVSATMDDINKAKEKAK